MQATIGYEDGMDHYYTYPNTELFPDFADPGTGWFDFIQSEGLRMLLARWLSFALG